MFAVMKHLDIMIGLDFHTTWPPWLPEPLASPTPFFVIMPMCGTMLTAQMAPTAVTLGQWTMQRGTDIGPLIPHIGMPSLLTPLDILMSSSASYFGPSSYMAGGAPVAAALMVNVNLNLNCNWCAPLPTGLVLCFTTHYCGMTLFDMLFGAISMGLAIGIDVAAGFAAGAAAKAVQKKVISPIAKRVTTKLASRKAAKSAAKSAVPNVPPSATKAAMPTTPWKSAKPTQAKPTTTWKSAKPSQAKPTPQKPTTTWKSAKPTKSVPTWKSAKPTPQKPAVPPQPGKWLPAKPNKGPKIGDQRKPDGPKLGDHRLPDPNKPPVKPAKPVKSKQRQAYDTIFEEMTKLLVDAPFTLVNELTLQLLAMSGIEEFGGQGEEEDKDEKARQEADARQAKEARKLAEDKLAELKKQADSKKAEDS